MPYVGTIAEIVAGVGTLVSDNNPARGRYIDLIVAEGIVSEKGVWEREPGAIPYTNNNVGSNLAKFLLPNMSYPSPPFPNVPGNASAVFATFTLNGTLTHVNRIAATSPSQVWSNNTTTQLTVGTDAAEHIPPGAAIVLTYLGVSPSASGQHPGGILSIVDDAGNTYQQITSFVVENGNGANQRVELWIALNVKEMGAGNRITLTPNAATPGGAVQTHHVTAHTFTGVAAADVFNTATTSVSPLVQPAALPAASSSEVMFIAYSDLGGAVGVTPNPTSLVAGGVTASNNFLINSIFVNPCTELFYSAYPFATASINALADYWISSATQRLLALGSDGILYKSSGGAFSALTMATVMQDDIAQIVIGGQETGEFGGKINRKAFVFDNGHTKIQVLTADGTSTTNFGNNWNSTTNIPEDWTGGVAGSVLVSPPRGGIIHKERLWCWATPGGPHNIYASSLTDQENFKNAVGGQFEYVQAIGVGTGIRIAAAASFKGMLFVFKYPRGIYYLDDTDVDYLNWRWNPVSDAIGVCDSPYAVIVLDDDILFVDPNGHLNFLSAVTQQGVASSDLTAALNLQQWTRDHINLAQLKRMTSTYYPAKKLAILGMARPTSTKNDLRLFLDFSNSDQEGQTVRISYSYRDVNQALAIRRDTEGDGTQKPILGDDHGTVWKMDQAGKSKVGFPNAGQARYQYNRTDFSHLDPSLGQRRKLFDALTIQFKPTGLWNLSVDSIIDGRYHETLLFSMGNSAFILGTSHFGIDKLGGGGITTTRRRMTGSGYWLSLAGYVTGEGQDFSVVKHYVNLRPGGEEQR